MYTLCCDWFKVIRQKVWLYVVYFAIEFDVTWAYRPGISNLHLDKTEGAAVLALSWTFMQHLCLCLQGSYHHLCLNSKSRTELYHLFWFRKLNYNSESSLELTHVAVHHIGKPVNTEFNTWYTKVFHHVIIVSVKAFPWHRLWGYC